MKKLILLICAFALIGGCTVIRNYGKLNYVPSSKTKVIDWSPDRDLDLKLLNNDKVQTIRNDTTK